MIRKQQQQQTNKKTSCSKLPSPRGEQRATELAYYILYGAFKEYLVCILS